MTQDSPPMKLIVQRYPLWLDLVVVTRFGTVMLFIAITQGDFDHTGLCRRRERHTEIKTLGGR
jgi:hypothetical protein